jgi:hypothetical protein
MRGSSLGFVPDQERDPEEPGGCTKKRVVTMPPLEVIIPPQLRSSSGCVSVSWCATLKCLFLTVAIGGAFAAGWFASLSVV